MLSAQNKNWADVHETFMTKSIFFAIKPLVLI